MNRASRRAGDPPDARTEAYAAMKDAMLNHLRIYYRMHPSRLLDDRSNQAVNASLEGLKEFFDILDKYDIAWKPGEKP
jgi:hypothetical protein